MRQLYQRSPGSVAKHPPVSQQLRVGECANDYLPNIYFEKGARKYQFKPDGQKLIIIDEQMDKFMKKYGRAPIDNNADYQTLKSMITERIKTVKGQELMDMIKKSPFCK